jgi:hypothetical protein
MCYTSYVGYSSERWALSVLVVVLLIVIDIFARGIEHQNEDDDQDEREHYPLRRIWL